MRYPRLALGMITVVAVGVLAAGLKSLGRGERRTATAAAGDAKPAEPATAPAEPWGASVLIRGVPHVRQKPDFCGEACAAMALNRLGVAVDQDWVFDQSGLDPAEGRGCHVKELAAALTKIGFRIGPVWREVLPSQRSPTLAGLWRELHADLRASFPSIVCMRYDGLPDTTEHFRLMLGYDAATDEVIYHEPAEDRGGEARMKRSEFLSLWPIRTRGNEWTAIRLRLEPGSLVKGSIAKGPTGADYAQQVMRLKKRLTGAEFTVVVEPPFVVAGDQPAEVVRRHAQGTIRWAVKRLKETYFARDPAEILEIWLLKDKDSYEKHCRAALGYKPTTPYGFYSESDHALVMNIATGGGTLVHELVHPFMAANFPACPAWFNEGLGSLYEQCGEDGQGRVRGYTNWRLAGLQKAIRQKGVLPFSALCMLADEAFYRDDRGANYAQARYLCYYLQEQGLLQSFYRRFAATGDRSRGYETLKTVLGRSDDEMKQFQQEWEQFVLGLTFP